MSGRQSLYVLGFHGAIAFACVVCATVLGWQGTLDASAITAIFGAALGFAGGAAASQGSLGAAINGKATVPVAALADRETTLRTAMAAAASSPSREIELEDAPPRGGEE